MGRRAKTAAGHAYDDRVGEVVALKRRGLELRRAQAATEPETSRPRRDHMHRARSWQTSAETGSHPAENSVISQAPDGFEPSQAMHLQRDDACGRWCESVPV